MATFTYLRVMILILLLQMVFLLVMRRPGRDAWDAQRSSANTNDLRGKILRITPQPDGTYTIPEGNLFPVGTPKTRPEIYVMGCRNPYRIAIDQRTNYLYWGDVGPDAGQDSLGRGSKGYDEVNQAREAGFFGWPYFIGKNYPYNDYDFATKESGPLHDPSAPKNISARNTGMTDLPPAQPAYIWYPYDKSEEFPEMGKGGRNAMAVGVYYYDDYNETDKRFPAYYDGKLFTYDWMRGQIFAVTMSDEGDFVRMEKFVPRYTFSNPIDIVFSDNGDMYMLEYGSKWYLQNKDARLIHLKYVAGNRIPEPKLVASSTSGAVPLTVDFIGDKSKDPDGDKITYEWIFEGDEVQSDLSNPSYTFEKPGEYKVSLTTRDGNGEYATVRETILVGNKAPEVDWNFASANSFYFDNQVLDYEVKVTDLEDGTIGAGIDPERISVNIDYLEQGKDIAAIAQGHQKQVEASNFFLGKSLMANSDCHACHQEAQKSVGPSYVDIAKKYAKDKNAVSYLTDKIIKGGGGVWGEHVMAAHPQLSKSETNQMVKYILSLGDWKGDKGLPYKGKYVLKDHIGSGSQGVYILSATYTDNGGDVIGPLSERKVIQLRSSVISALDYDQIRKATELNVVAGDIPGVEEEVEFIMGNPDGYIVFEQLNLTGIKTIQLGIGKAPGYLGGGAIELRLNGPEGRIIGSLDVKQGLTEIGLFPEDIIIEAVEGVNDLYIMFDTKGDELPVCALIDITFKN